MKFREHKSLIKILLDKKPKKIAEIGVSKGHLIQNILSKSSCSEFLTEYWAIDQWLSDPSFDNIVWARRTKKEYKEICLEVYKLMLDFPILKIIHLDSVSAAKIFPDRYFDLVFIDASHIYEDVIDDIIAWWPKVKDEGILCGDDYGGKFYGVKKAVDQLFGSKIPKNIGPKAVIHPHGIWEKQVKHQRYNLEDYDNRALEYMKSFKYP